MQSVRTEELLVQVGQAVAGHQSPQDLVPMIEVVAATTQATWQKFLIETTEDAEMPAETREAIAKALEDYLDSLERMREAASTEDLQALAGVAQDAQQNVESIRAAQDAHKAALAQGPTSFPYLNRLLIQYAVARDGGNSMRLRALLNDSGTFTQWLRTELAGREVSPEEAQSVFHLQQFLDALQQAVEGDGELPDIEEDLADLAAHLQTLLVLPSTDAHLVGPTPIPAVNQVLHALSSCSGSQVEFDFLLSVIDQCRSSLRGILPISSPSDLVSHLNTVLENLARMEECLTQQIGFDELVTSATDLEFSANALDQAISDSRGSSRGAEEYSPQTEGLHPMLRSVLEPAYVFLDGGGDADTVFEASDHLELTATSMRKDAAERGIEGDERTLAIQDAVEFMNEAAEMLREVATNGNSKLLEMATALCFQAAARLQEAGIK